MELALTDYVTPSSDVSASGADRNGKTGLRRPGGVPRARDRESHRRFAGVFADHEGATSHCISAIFELEHFDLLNGMMRHIPTKLSRKQYMSDNLRGHT